MVEGLERLSFNQTPPPTVENFEVCESDDLDYWIRLCDVRDIQVSNIVLIYFNKVVALIKHDNITTGYLMIEFKNITIRTALSEEEETWSLMKNQFVLTEFLKLYCLCTSLLKPSCLPCAQTKTNPFYSRHEVVQAPRTLAKCKNLAFSLSEVTVNKHLTWFLHKEFNLF